MNRKKLKLYIWTEFCPDYTDGLAFAIASSEKEAKELVETQRGYAVYTWGNLEIRTIGKRVARAVSGGG